MYHKKNQFDQIFLMLNYAEKYRSSRTLIQPNTVYSCLENPAHWAGSQQRCLTSPFQGEAGAKCSRLDSLLSVHPEMR
jgi:hypothetical protein